MYIRCHRCGQDCVGTWHVRLKNTNFMQYEYYVCRACFGPVHEALCAVLDEGARLRPLLGAERDETGGVRAVRERRVSTLWGRLSRRFEEDGF